MSPIVELILDVIASGLGGGTPSGRSVPEWIADRLTWPRLLVLWIVFVVVSIGAWPLMLRVRWSIAMAVLVLLLAVVALCATSTLVWMGRKRNR